MEIPLELLLKEVEEKYGIQLEPNFEAPVTTPEAARPIVWDLLSFYQEEKVEAFGVITLDSSMRVINSNLMSKGILNQTPVHPREVFWYALQDKAAYLFLCHNHPSGTVEPSDADKRVTERLLDASDIMGIPIRDHFIISRSGFTSMRQATDLWSGKD